MPCSQAAACHGHLPAAVHCCNTQSRIVSAPDTVKTSCSCNKACLQKCRCDRPWATPGRSFVQGSRFNRPGHATVLGSRAGVPLAGCTRFRVRPGTQLTPFYKLQTMQKPQQTSRVLSTVCRHQSSGILAPPHDYPPGPCSLEASLQNRHWSVQHPARPHSCNH